MEGTHGVLRADRVHLDGMVTTGIIAPVSQPTEWVSSLAYHCKPDGTLCICLDPKDHNKAIVQEHYKAPTLNEVLLPAHTIQSEDVPRCLSDVNGSDKRLPPQHYLNS